jgi:hypothetical protein
VLLVSSASGPNEVTVTGSRSIDGAILATWVHSEIMNQPKDIVVAAGERHQVLVQASFTSDATVTVTMRRDGVDVVPPCTLTQIGNDQCAIALIAASDQGDTG